MQPKFLKAICGLFGIVYLIFALCMTNYGTRLSMILYAHLHEEGEHNYYQNNGRHILLKTLNKRVTLLSCVKTL